MEQSQEQKTRKIFFAEGKMVLTLFLAGTALFIWITNSVLTPMTRLQEVVANLRDNHIHTIEVKIDQLQENTAAMQGQLIKLQTILEERLPSK